jgi:hypothetical protein
MVSFTVTTNGRLVDPLTNLSVTSIGCTSGTVTVYLKSNRSTEPVVMTVISDGLSGSSIIVNSNIDDVSYMIELVSQKNSVIADERDIVSITAIVKDFYGNVITGREIPVRFDTNGYGVILDTGTVVTDSLTGKISVLMKSGPIVSTITVYAYSDGLSTGVLSMCSVSGQPDHVGLTASPAQLYADDASTCVVTVTILDKNNNPVLVSGTRIVFDIMGKQYGDFYGTLWKTGEGSPYIGTVNGTGTILIKSTKQSGKLTLVAEDKYSVAPVTPATVDINFVSGIASRVHVTCIKNRIVTGLEPVLVTARVVDVNNNTVESATGTVKFTVYNGTNKRNEYIVSMSSGIAELNFTETVSGLLTIQAESGSLTAGYTEFTGIWNKTIGGEYVFSDMKTKLDIPAWAIDVNFSVSLATSVSFVNVDKTNVKLAESTAKDLRLIDESGTEIINPQFSKDVTVTIGYVDADNNDIEDTMNIPVDKLKMFYISQRRSDLGRPEDLGANQLTWLRNFTIDKTNKTIFAKVSHFTVFVLGAYDNTENVLFQNYPNPVCPSRDRYTRIEYSLSSVIPVQTGIQCSVKVYNIAGDVVRILVDKIVLSGTKTYVDWDGKNDTGDIVSDGVYFCQLITPDYKKLIKILLIK